jgi:signal transduction histidine kinase/ligand-binding sensor domain-containing protein/DNA-binding response OmpR family regulator
MQIIKNKITLLLISLFLYLNNLFSQQPIKFKHLKVQDGLSQSWVKTICQDQQGFMWFGTYDGLNKYDGYSITSYYQKSGNNHSLHNNSINTIYNDSKGNLWIGTDWGFCLYDHSNNQFIHRPQWSKGLTAQFLELTDERNFIAALDRGLLIYDLKTGSVEPFVIQNYEQLNMNISSMLKNSRGNIWFGTTNGLALFNPVDNRVTFYNNESNKSHSLSGSDIVSLLEDRQGRIWAGTDNNGLFLIQYEANHPEETRFTHFVHNPKIESSISPGVIKALLEDKTGHLWIGTENGGLDIIDLNNFQEDKVVFHHNRHDPFDNTSLSNNSIYSLFEDCEGGIWIGTYGDGVNYYHPQKEKFVHIKQQLNNSNSLNNNFVNVLYEEDSLLWIGTENGINLFNKKDGSYRYFVHDANNEQTIGSNAIWSIFRDSRHNLWVGTWAGGLSLFDSNTGTCKRFQHDDRKNGSIASNNISGIYEDRKGTLWICTIGGGIDQFDYNTKTFKIIEQGSDDSHRLTNNSVNTILEDSFGKIWISTTGGVDVFDRAAGTFKHFSYYTSDTKSVGGIVYIFFEDSQKNLWLGTNNGLNVFDRNENNFDRYTKEDGLPNNQIKGILEDAKGNLWISTNKGLSKFVQAIKRPREPIFKNYDLDDGLQGIEFTVRSCWPGQDGKMYFGGNNGYNVFHPDSIKDNVSIPPVIITNFLIDNKQEPIRVQNSLLSTYNDKLRKVTLNHKQSGFTVEYVMLNYFSSSKNKYAYMLEGFDKDWNYVGSQRLATYTNLDPGDYVLRVKGTINNDWDQVEASINIKVIPPWWKTNWAYLFYLIFTGFIVFNVWRFQLNRRALKHELLLEHQHAEKLEELNKMKSHFFANITHEFRSPLTLIMGPIQQFVSGEVKENFQENAKMILRNSKRMYHLINQILELSKLETGYIQLQAQKIDIIPVIEKIMRLYTSFAESKNINLQFIGHDVFKRNTSSAELYIDVDKIQKVIVNLLSNALKYTPQNGNVSVSIERICDESLDQNEVSDEREVKRTHNFLGKWIFPRHNKENTEIQTDNSVFSKLAKHGYIEICVKDNGIGIRDKDLDKIFNRFYQGIDPHSGDYDSVGIGLALTKELVELHSGTIHVESVYEQSTEFIVRLPLGHDHLLPSEIIQHADNGVNILGYSPDEIDDNLMGRSARDENNETDENRGPIILIVDDNADIRKYVVDHLRTEYRVITAKDGWHGLEKAKHQIPDLIVSDINMPQMNGIELCSKIKADELTCHIPVILLTVKASKDAKIEGLEIGADDYITKPFEIWELKARIKNLIEQRRQLKKKYTLEHGIQPSEIATNSMDEQFLSKALSIVELNIIESMFGVDELSKQMSISRSQLYRKILAITGQTPVEFIRSIRLNRAAQLLKQKHDNIGRIAYEVGFSNPSYFSNSFHKQFGMYPTEYVKQFK